LDGRTILVEVETTVVTGLVITTLVTTVVTTVPVPPVVVTGAAAVVNIETVHGPVAATAPLEFRLTALTSHQ